MIVRTKNLAALEAIRTEIHKNYPLCAVSVGEGRHVSPDLLVMTEYSKVEVDASGYYVCELPDEKPIAAKDADWSALSTDTITVDQYMTLKQAIDAAKP